MTDTSARAAGTEVRALDGHVGEIDAVAVHPRDLAATWLVVSLAGGGRVAVPAAAASIDADGVLRLPFTRSRLLDAPRVLGDVVDADLARVLLAHFELPA